MCFVSFGLKVEWENEQDCFDTLAKEISRLYAFKPDPSSSRDHNPSSDKNLDADDIPECDTSWQWTAEHVLLPAVRTGLVPPARFSEDGTLLQIANLTELYKVFERC
jgi:DNA mismatch repair protein MLH1